MWRAPHSHYIICVTTSTTVTVSNNGNILVGGNEKCKTKTDKIFALKFGSQIYSQNGIFTKKQQYSHTPLHTSNGSIYSSTLKVVIPIRSSNEIHHNGCSCNLSVLTILTVRIRTKFLFDYKKEQTQCTLIPHNHSTNTLHTFVICSLQYFRSKWWELFVVNYSSGAQFLAKIELVSTASCNYNRICFSL